MMKVTIRVAGEVLKALEDAGLTPSDYGFAAHPPQQAAVEVDFHAESIARPIEPHVNDESLVTFMDRQARIRREQGEAS